MLPDVRLGPTDTMLRPLGLGVWQWGDSYWSYDPTTAYENARAAFTVSLDAGVTLIDTAEAYGKGESERTLGRLIAETGRRPFIATKFQPLPRLRPSSVATALEGSLERLGVDCIDLYQVHHPFSILRMEHVLGRIADAVRAGKVRHVGVSNYNERQMRKAHRLLARRGIPLVSNQVHYSLLHRAPEANGVLAACRELDITLIAYSPLAQGALTGKYGPGRGKVSGMRRFRRVFRHLGRAMPLVEALEEIGRVHDRTAAQVALNWLAAQPNVIPIPGARDGRQAEENAHSIDFHLSEAEMALLDGLTRVYRRHGRPIIDM
ncbi:MAG TPA: aldo/keto reductase [Dehalococcoidia bacterium]|nr:aldo/keto reductase [Dehalococcoidia bacterium]